ncbi:MAG: HlyC/CorC family transporter [Oscillospiraceae bacterium]|nr:HlyC/CorC family transporter [Oscillospiraceae bacterium]
MDPDGSLLTHSILAAPAASLNVWAVHTAPPAALALCIGLFVLFLVLCAFFTLCETALEEYSESRLEKLAAEGDRRAALFLQMAQRYSSLAAKVRAGFVLSVMACEGMLLAGPSTWLAAALAQKQGIGISLALALSVALSILVGAALVLIAGYLLPRHLAWRDPNRTACSAAGPLQFCIRLVSPLGAFCRLISNGILRLMGIDPNTDPQEGTEEDIREMVDAGNEKGLIPQSEREMIYNVFEFDDRTAEDVMTHRTEIEAVQADNDIDDALKIAIEEGFSRIPVYEDTLDNVVGILYAKDLLMLIGKGDQGPRTIRALMRPALYVPESTRCRDLFRQFQQKKVQIAIVVDEYGGTSGMVTMEDLLESIVGEIQDEYDEEEELVTRISDGVYHIDGSADLEDVQRFLPLEVLEEADYDTLSGLLTDALGRIPVPGEHPEVTLSGIRFTVLEMDERRIGRVKAEVLPPEPEEEA